MLDKDTSVSPGGEGTGRRRSTFYVTLTDSATTNGKEHLTEKSPAIIDSTTDKTIANSMGLSPSKHTPSAADKEKHRRAVDSANSNHLSSRTPARTPAKLSPNKLTPEHNGTAGRIVKTPAKSSSFNTTPSSKTPSSALSAKPTIKTPFINGKTPSMKTPDNESKVNGTSTFWAKTPRASGPKNGSLQSINSLNTSPTKNGLSFSKPVGKSTPASSTTSLSTTASSRTSASKT